MDDNDFINDPLFNSLRKFSSSPEDSQIMPTKIRNAFREGIKSSKKRRFAWRGAIGAGLMVIAFPTFAVAKILPAPFQHIVENINRVITSPVHILIESVTPPKKAVTKSQNVASVAIVGNDESGGNTGIVGNVVKGSHDLGNFDLNLALGDIQGIENNQENQNSNSELNAPSTNSNKPVNQEQGKPNLHVLNSLPTLANNLNPITTTSGITGSQGFSITGSQSDVEGTVSPQASDNEKP